MQDSADLVGSRSAFGCAKPLICINFLAAMLRQRLYCFGIRSVCDRSRSGAPEIRCKSSTFRLPFAQSPVLLIRRSLVRVQVGEPEFKGYIARCSPFSIKSTDRFSQISSHPSPARHTKAHRSVRADLPKCVEGRASENSQARGAPR
jgi:hypothetical protein